MYCRFLTIVIELSQVFNMTQNYTNKIKKTPACWKVGQFLMSGDVLYWRYSTSKSGQQYLYKYIEYNKTNCLLEFGK